ncbi:MAG: hypothetical protein J5720_00810 [Bacteroidaceae bacterium]|nr:hypothetical protein [Bacteroidaceae bacterium]
MLYLCYSINDFYAREAGISMLSFLDNNPDYEPDEVFFIDYGIVPANKERLNSIAARYGKRVTYLNGKPVTAAMKRQFPNYSAWKGSMAACIKPFFDKIMPEYVERLLYLDADTIVAGSVEELQHIDMGDAVVAGTISNSEGHRLLTNQYQLYSGNKIYMGSGVLLFDLKNWRRENCYQRVVDVLGKKKRFRLPDQMLINNAIPERLMKVLPQKYNYVTHSFHPWQEYQMMMEYDIYTAEECREAIDHPVIIHYLTGWMLARPWHKGCRSHRKEEYYHYKALSPWKDTPLAPSIQTMFPPKTFQDKVFLFFFMLFMKPIPYQLSMFFWKMYGKLENKRKRRKGIYNHSDEGIEDIDFQSGGVNSEK